MKQKSTMDAIIVLQKKIYQVWQNKKILLLITVDVIEVFNNGAILVLLEKL